MNVRCVGDEAADGARWDAFVEAHPQATSDHRWGWRRVLTGAFGFSACYLAAEDGERLLGVLPLFRVPRGLRGAALVSIPFGNYGGICAATPEAAQALLDAAKRLMRDTGAGSLLLRHRAPLDDQELTTHAGAHSRFYLSLTGDAEAHFRQIGQHNRSKIQRARRRGLQLERSRRAEDIYPIYLHTAHRQGVPCFPRRYFELIFEAFGTGAEAWVLTLDGRRVAYYLVLKFRETLVGQFSGSFSSAYAAYPNELLCWTAIELGCREGFKEFDFCRSRLGSGTADFKRKLRLSEAPMHDQRYEPARSLGAGAHAQARRLVQSWWKASPLWVTQLIGPHVVRYLA